MKIHRFVIKALKDPTKILTKLTVLFQDSRKMEEQIRKKIQVRNLEIHRVVIKALRGPTRKLRELTEDRQWEVLGFRKIGETYRVILQDFERLIVVLATRKMKKNLLYYLDFFQTEEDRYGRELFWLIYFTESIKPTECRKLTLSIKTSSYVNKKKKLKYERCGNKVSIRALQRYYPLSILSSDQPDPFLVHS